MDLTPAEWRALLEALKRADEGRLVPATRLLERLTARSGAQL